MMIHDLFPTPLGVFDIERNFTKTEINFIKNQNKRSNMGNTTSINNEILNNAKLKKLKQFVETSVDEYFKLIYVPKNKTSLRITQSWCNYTEPNGYHHKHAHPNSFISGVIYIQTNNDTDKIYFERNQYEQLKTPADSWNVYNSESWWMEAITGRMFIFPSSLTHVVEVVQGEDTRISLSFNTFPVGNFGHDESLTGLHL